VDVTVGSLVSGYPRVNEELDQNPVHALVMAAGTKQELAGVLKSIYGGAEWVLTEESSGRG
jgi:hypothetical protein